MKRTKNPVSLAVRLLAAGLLIPAVAVGSEAVQRTPVQLAVVPAQPLPADEATVYRQDFEGSLTGASGEFQRGPGRWGSGLQLQMPDGRYDVAAADWDWAQQGTIEWWVQPRPAAQIWRNQGWHYFLHVRPEQPDGFQLDLWRHPLTSLRLSASRGLAPHGPIDQPPERIEIDTRNLDIDAWHHLVVSWDLAGERQRIWLLLNGSGQQLCVPAGTFPPGRFASLEFGNRPSGWQTPFIPLDGAIDALRVQAESVANRLAQE